MRFFGRKTETAELLKIREASKREARMTVVTGRRRVGKTELIRHALDDGKTPFVYFLITRAPQSAVCENLQREIARAFGRPMPGRIDLAALKAKTEAFYAKNPDMRNLASDCKGLSPADM